MATVVAVLLNLYFNGAETLDVATAQAARGADHA